MNHGVLRATADPDKHCMCFVRVIEDIAEHLEHPRVSRFIDLTSDGVDTEAQNSLVSLRDESITRKLKNVYR